MNAIQDIRQRAQQLAAKWKKSSISPEEVGLLIDDLAALTNDAVINGINLGIRKIYLSVAAMNQDNTSPVDHWGQPIKRGQLVAIASSDSDNGKVYMFTGSGWAYVTTMIDFPKKFENLISKVNFLDENAISIDDFPEWKANTDYEEGEYVFYKGSLLKSLGVTGTPTMEEQAGDWSNSSLAEYAKDINRRQSETAEHLKENILSKNDFPEWKANTDYEEGEYVFYKGSLLKSLGVTGTPTMEEQAGDWSNSTLAECVRDMNEKIKDGEPFPHYTVQIVSTLDVMGDSSNDGISILLNRPLRQGDSIVFFRRRRANIAGRVRPRYRGIKYCLQTRHDHNNSRFSAKLTDLLNFPSWKYLEKNTYSLMSGDGEYICMGDLQSCFFDEENSFSIKVGSTIPKKLTKISVAEKRQVATVHLAIGVVRFHNEFESGGYELLSNLAKFKFRYQNWKLNSKVDEDPILQDVATFCQTIIIN